MQRKFLTCLATVVLALTACVTASAQTYPSAVLGLNPAGYWPLNETAQPPQPLSLTATNSGTLGAGGNGYYGAWYQPSGSQWYLTNNIVMEPGPTANGDKAMNCQYAQGQYIVLPRTTNGVSNGALTIKPPFSIEAWVNPGTTAGRAGTLISEGQVELSTGGNSTTNLFNGGVGESWAGFGLGQYDNFFYFDCFNTNGNSKANELDAPKSLVANGGWIYLVCTFDGSTEIMYTNGVQAGSKSVTANAVGQKYVPDLTSPLMIGSGTDIPNDYGTAWTGGVGEVAIYNEVLPGSSMLAHYQAAGGTNATYGANYSAAVLADNPILYFRMNDNQSPANAGYPSATFPIATNYGTLGSVANGVYQPGTTPGVAGPKYAGFGANSASVAINGWLGAVDVGSSNLPAELNPTGAAPMTVVSWYQTDPADAPGRFQEILGHSDSSYRLALGQNTPDGENHFNAGPGPELQFTSAAQVITNGFALNDGQWHMVAGVSDGTNEYLYLDGSLALSNNNPAGIKIVGSSDDLVLGGDPEYTTANGTGTYNTIRNLDGQIAQVAFWTNALTAAQIQSLFNAAEVPPSIWQEPSPASTSINAGQNVTVTSGIRGSSVSYQWYQNGVAVTGQTNANLMFTPATTADAGSFYLIAHNSYGAVTSSVVTLVVYGPPSVTQQSPTQLQIFSGASPTLHVSVSGATPLDYQWSLNGTPITDATNSSYTLTNLQASGSYGCAVTNTLGTTGISPITVNVLSDPTAPYPQQVLANGPIAYYRLDEAPGSPTAYDYVGGDNAEYTNTVLGNPGYTSENDIQSDPTETCAEFGNNPPNDYAGNVPSYVNFGTPNGSNAEFSVEAWINQFSYQGNGNCIVGLGYGNGGEQFVLDTGAGTTTGTLRFFVRNAAGTVCSATSTNDLSNDGDWHHVVGVCDEAGGHVYVYLDGHLAASATIPVNSGLLSSTMPLSIGARESGNNNPTNYDFQFYGFVDDVSIYNKALSATQVQADFYASGVPPLNVSVQPTSYTTNQGASVTFTSTSEGGSPPLSYQWYDEYNNPIIGQTNTSLVLSNLESTQSGTYTLDVTNDYGSTNLPVNLTVTMGPATIPAGGDITPTNVVTYAGTAVSLAIAPTGSQPFYYQWYQDGSALAGATNMSYNFAALLGTNTYYCTVSNVYSYSEGSGPATSSTATVAGEPVTTVNPADFNSRLKIEFTGYNRSEVLQDFPALVRLSTNLPGFSYSGFAAPNGADLRFADANGTRELPYEVEQWDGSNGVSSVWVQVPTLSGGTNNFIWAYWGNPGDSNPPAYTTNGMVWEPAAFQGLPGYEVVYHLQETNFPYLDSTLNYPALAGVAPTQAGGIVGNGEFFDGSSDYLDAGDINLGNEFTESAWVNLPTGESNIQGIWVNGAGGYSSAEIALFVNFYNTADGGVLVGTGDGTNGQQPETAPNLVTSNQWHLVTAAVNRTAGTVAMYVDGQLGGTGATMTDFPTNADMELGRFTSGSFPFHGLMDEARIHGGIDDSNWVWADYQTVASNSVFTAYSSVTNTVALPSLLTIQRSGNQIILNWSGGTLQSAGEITGPFVNVPGATSPYTNTVTGTQQFYRVQGQW